MKGQAFSTLKILIGAVFAVMLLTIIYYVSVYHSPIPSAEALKKLALQANNAPNECISTEEVYFVKGEIIIASAAFFSPITVSCVSSSYPASSSPISCSSCSPVLPSGDCCGSCKIDREIKTAVSARCSQTTGTVCNVHIYLGSGDCT